MENYSEMLRSSRGSQDHQHIIDNITNVGCEFDSTATSNQLTCNLVPAMQRQSNKSLIIRGVRLAPSLRTQSDVTSMLRQFQYPSALCHKTDIRSMLRQVELAEKFAHQSFDCTPVLFAHPAFPSISPVRVSPIPDRVARFSFVSNFADHCFGGSPPIMPNSCSETSAPVRAAVRKRGDDFKKNIAAAK